MIYSLAVSEFFFAKELIIYSKSDINCPNLAVENISFASETRQHVMAKNYFNRYIWLIDLIQRSGHISFEDISRAWRRSTYNEYGENLSERTFFNHKKAIFDTFGIEIKCDRSLGYR